MKSIPVADVVVVVAAAAVDVDDDVDDAAKMLLALTMRCANSRKVNLSCVFGDTSFSPEKN
jgi:hypothetical protein